MPRDTFRKQDAGLFQFASDCASALIVSLTHDTRLPALPESCVRRVNGHLAVTVRERLDEESTADDSKCLIRWWAHQDSNLKPRDYESPALTVEL